MPIVGFYLRGEIHKRGLVRIVYYNFTSRFQIAIDLKTIIIGYVFIETKFCVRGGERTKFSFV